MKTFGRRDEVLPQVIKPQPNRNINPFRVVANTQVKEDSDVGQ